MRNKYITFISFLSKRYSQEFGSIWWYSLLHEKNSAGKSRTYHNLIKDLQPLSFSVYRAFYLALRKYIGFIVRHFIFIKQRYKMYVGYDTLYITYSEDFLSPLSNSQPKIYLPQKNNYKELKNEWVIDLYISKMDLLKLFFKYFSCLWKNSYLLPILKKEFKPPFDYKYFKEEIWRSFAGDVLVEGLFYETAFTNMAKQFKNLKKVVYPYEGQAWEKALCRGFNQSDNRPEIVAILCACPPLNMLNYWYDKEEVELMPTPDRVGVLGNTTYNLFKEMYGNKTFIAGPMRFRVVEKYIGTKLLKSMSNKILVVLPGVKEYADELLNFISCIDVEDYELIVKPHPDYMDIKKGRYTIWEGEDVMPALLDSRAIISIDSSVSLMAVALNIPIIIPDLPTVAIMNPLFGINSFGLSWYFAAIPNDASKVIKRLNGGYSMKSENREIVKKSIEEYFDFSKNEREELNNV